MPPLPRPPFVGAHIVRPPSHIPPSSGTQCAPLHPSPQSPRTLASPSGRGGTAQAVTERASPSAKFDTPLPGRMAFAADSHRFCHCEPVLRLVRQSVPHIPRTATGRPYPRPPFVGAHIVRPPSHIPPSSGAHPPFLRRGRRPRRPASPSPHPAGGHRPPLPSSPLRRGAHCAPAIPHPTIFGRTSPLFA